MCCDFPLQAKAKKPVTSNYPQDFLDQFVVRPQSPLKFHNKIAEGCYGSIYAIDLDGTPCIAKRLQDILMGRRREEPVDKETKDVFHKKFHRECVLLSQVKHPNIVKFIGVHCGEDKYDLTLIIERLSTDLHRYLCKTPNIPLSLKVSILYDVVQGLLRLHQQAIIHRDLTAANILLTADLHAKIADLGVSRIIDSIVDTQLSTVPGTLSYMPPEALRDKPEYNESLDIFSFGVLVLFVANQTFPQFSWDRVPEEEIKKAEGEVYKRRHLIKQMNDRQPEFGSIVLWCLQDNPTRRPSGVCLSILLQELRVDHPMDEKCK